MSVSVHGARRGFAGLDRGVVNGEHDGRCPVADGQLGEDPADVGSDARLWLTMHSSIRATTVLDNQQVSRLTSTLCTEPGTDE